MMLFLLILAGFALYVMTPEERARLVRAVLAAIRQVKDAATQDHPELEPFRDALRARTRWALVTPVLVALNATVFVYMLFGAGALSDAETLVGWGGNFGPRTTNGEWWRLVTMMFVHSGVLQLLANLAGLVQLGLILERLVGPAAFAGVYVASGMFASLVSLSAHPVAVRGGASGAIYGLYGLLLASSIWGLLNRSTVTIPRMAVKRLGPAAAVFILYNMATDDLAGAAELAGLVTGFVCGLVLARGVSDCKPPARRVAAAMAATAVIAVACAVPLRGIADVRPEIARVFAVEDRTARAYQTAVDRFRKGRITGEALAQLIDRTIRPELQAAHARLKALARVPQEHQPLVASAEEFLRLRDESWRLRAEGLHTAKLLASREAERTAEDESWRWRLKTEGLYTANVRTLQEAERTERASLAALKRIGPADQK